MMQLTWDSIKESRILTIGVLLTALLAASMVPGAKPAHASTTFTVTNTSDSGAGSLRQAILDANNTTGADVIDFDIPGTGVHTIAPASQLPTIMGPVTINGYSQPGAQPNQKAVGSDADLRIQLSRVDDAPGEIGLDIGAANSTVKGLIINRWNIGIRIDGPGATGNRIAGNFIGTDASGTQTLGTSHAGVYLLFAPNNTVGGATAAARNVISGNEYGVVMGGADGNKISGNYIGTDASGTKDLGNGFGIIAEGGSNSVIGGSTASERNVVSANDADGVLFGGNRNKVSGNFIGTDASGTKDLGNGGNGVALQRASDNVVGGTTVGERNVISGNDKSGVDIEGADATGNVVMGNYLGTDKNGAALGNSADGVFISYSSHNTVGGTTDAARNVISANAGSGVSIFGAGATGDRVLQNSIFSNGGLGIDLGDDGPTPNDPEDADTGPNNLQNFPVLSSARKSASGTTTIRGKLESAPSTTFRVQIFSNPQGGNEGKTLLGSGSVFADGSGNVTFSFSSKKAIRLGQTITATATGPGGNTSEFSAPRKVVAR